MDSIGPADDDLDRPRIPAVVYLIVIALAVIGLFSISGMILGAVFWLARLVFIGVVALAVLWILKTVFFGRSSRRADSEL
jgi:hypothetical protein